MRRNVVVIGASAGGVEALRSLVSALPNDLPAAVLVVLHVPTYGGSVLPAILSRAGLLPAAHAVHGEQVREGRIYVAPPDHHLALDDERIVLSRGPRENGHRPAIDVLFRTAARAFGPRLIGVVLSGVLDDGTAGLAGIAARGGATAVQEPGDALYPSMPKSAIEHVAVDHVDTAEGLGHLLARLCKEELGDAERPASPLLEVEAELAMMDDVAMSMGERPGRPSGFSCPDCNGVLWEIQDGADGNLIRYRCRVGHAWSAESLFGEQAQQLEGALWMALRGLEEKAALAREMGERAHDRNSPLTAQRFAEQAEDAGRAASLIRSMLEAHIGSPEQPSET